MATDSKDREREAFPCEIQHCKDEVEVPRTGHEYEFDPGTLRTN